MSELLACQNDLAGALSDPRESARAMRWLAGDAALAERRFAIYRANVEAATTKALAADQLRALGGLGLEAVRAATYDG